jgi:hypothetical protein
MGLGISSAYAYWSVLLSFSMINIVADPCYGRYGFHLKAGQCTLVLRFQTIFVTFDLFPAVQRQEEFYLKLERQKQEA